MEWTEVLEDIDKGVKGLAVKSGGDQRVEESRARDDDEGRNQDETPTKNASPKDGDTHEEDGAKKDNANDKKETSEKEDNEGATPDHVDYFCMLRGLPWEVEQAELEEFFEGIAFVKDSAFVCKKANGQSTVRHICSNYGYPIFQVGF